MNSWVDVGKNIGLAFGGAAKELGLAVNEFIHSPIGVLAVVLIVWNFIGGAILHILAGLVILLFAVWFVRWHYDVTTNKIIVYDPITKNIFGNRVVTGIQRDGVDGDWAGIYVAIYFITGAVSIILFVSA